MIIPYNPPRFLWSASQNRLQVSKTSTQFYGDCAFQVAAPTLWNSLPLPVRHCNALQSFKSTLKTYLFLNDVQ